MQLPKKPKHEFWVTNIATNKDISLSDLRVTIRKGQTVNLLDSRHYHFTYEQLEKSKNNGDIKAKSRWIKVRNLPPRFEVEPGLHVAKDFRYAPAKIPSVKIEYKNYEDLGDKQELKELEEKIAQDYADIILSDNVPALAKDSELKKEIVPNTRKLKTTGNNDDDY